MGRVHVRHHPLRPLGPRRRQFTLRGVEHGIRAAHGIAAPLFAVLLAVLPAALLTTLAGEEFPENDSTAFRPFARTPPPATEICLRLVI